MRLDGKKVFITGGTGGIGKPLVELLKDSGALVDIYDRKKEGDLADNIEQACATVSKSPPDILVNMAGYNLFDHCENQDAESLIKINLLTPIRLTQAALPGMKARGSGQIVNIGSMSALIPLPHLTAYVASKAGLKGFSDSLRRELSGTGIHVTLVTPRAVNTSANKGLKAVLNKKTGIKHDDPDAVAERIFKAICRREKDVRIGWPERFFALVNAVFPSLVDLGLQKNRDIGNQLLSQYQTDKEKYNEKSVTPVRRAVS